MIMNILDVMKEKLFASYLGEDNAHHRLDLLEHLRLFFPDLTDRKMRMIYSKNFPIGHSSRGIFLLDDIDEIDRINEIMKKKVKTYNKKIAWYESIRMGIIRRRLQKQEQMRLFR